MGAYVFVAIEKSEYLCDYDEDCAYVRACNHHGRPFVCLFFLLISENSFSRDGRHDKSTRD